MSSSVLGDQGGAVTATSCQTPAAPRVDISSLITLWITTCFRFHNASHSLEQAYVLHHGVPTCRRRRCPERSCAVGCSASPTFFIQIRTDLSSEATTSR